MAIASIMLPLGTSAPPFALRDVVSGRTYSLDSFVGKAALLVLFICRHCLSQTVEQRSEDRHDTRIQTGNPESQQQRPTAYLTTHGELERDGATPGFSFSLLLRRSHEVAKAKNALLPRFLSVRWATTPVIAPTRHTVPAMANP